MELLITQALPPPRLAPTLAAHLTEDAPILAHWLRRARRQAHALDPMHTLCTAEQAWLLRRAGFVPTGEQAWSSAWPAWVSGRSQPYAAEPIWFAQPCHWRVTQHGVTLLDLSLGDDDRVDLRQLAAAIAPDLVEAGIRVTGDTGVPPWQWRLPEGWDIQAATAACAQGQEIQTWWSQRADLRPWRRLLNLIQMIWHEHPVNRKREARGLPVINGIWLYGGVAPTALPRLTQSHAVQIHALLESTAMLEDPAVWRASLKALNREVLEPLVSASNHKNLPASLTVTLTGTRRCLTLTASPWPRWLAARRRGLQDWQDAPEISASPGEPR